MLPRANRSAEGCYRRRWKGEEIGMRGEEGGGGGGRGRDGERSRGGAVSCTEDDGWRGGTSCEGVMICRVSRRAERRLQRPFLVVRPERPEGGGKSRRGSDSQAGLDGFLLLSILFPLRPVHPSSLSLFLPPAFLFNSAVAITAARHRQSHLSSCLFRFASFIFPFLFLLLLRLLHFLSRG